VSDGDAEVRENLEERYSRGSRPAAHGPFCDGVCRSYARISAHYFVHPWKERLSRILAAQPRA
jgi:hypothetical protein